MAKPKPSFKPVKPEAKDSGVSPGSKGKPAKRSHTPSQGNAAGRGAGSWPNWEDSPFAGLAGLRAQLKDKEREEELGRLERRRLAKKAEKAARAKVVRGQPEKGPVEPPGERYDEKADQAFFEEAMSGVVPIGDNRLFVPEPLPAKRWSLPSVDLEELSVVRDLVNLVNGKSEFDFSSTDELLEAQAKDLPPGIMEQLKKGLIPVQDHLDVHGFTLPEAAEAINAFVTKSVYLGRTCLLLVHGRGHRSPDGIPIIKRNLEHLLLRGPVKKYIWAFTTARPIDGGSGASYILLRG
ncbi:MAG: Smr/MutS family protein [Deltaproteobacteria bacterium]|nr:Smr/MutS family protein [Deltaproteobacteria bacterium]